MVSSYPQAAAVRRLPLASRHRRLSENSATWPRTKGSQSGRDAQRREAGQGLPRERRLRQARASAPVLFRSVGFKLFVGAVSQRESLLKVYFKLNRCGSRVDNSQHVPTSKRTRIDQRERARSSPVNGDDN